MAQYVIDITAGAGVLEQELSSAEKALEGFERQARGVAGAVTGLFAGIDVSGALEQMQKTVKRTTTTVRKEAKKALLSFDRIERIGAQSTSTTKTTSTTTTTQTGGTLPDNSLPDSVQVLGLAAAFGALQAAISGAMGAFQSGRIAQELVRIRTMVEGVLGMLLQPSVVAAVSAGVAAIVALLAGPVGAGVGVLMALAAGLAGEMVALIVQKWNELSALFSKVGAWFQTNLLQPLGVLFSGGWNLITQGAMLTWERIQAVFAPAVTWFSALFGSVWSTVSGVFQNIGVVASGCWRILKAAWSGAADWFSVAVIQPVKHVFDGLWNGFVRVVSVAWEKVRGTFSQMVGFFKGILNGVIRMINDAIRWIFSGVNNIILNVRGIEVMGFAPFADLQPINTPQIPYLAKGAVLPANKPFLAVVGDQRNGKNLEAPAEEIYRQARRAMEELLGQMDSSTVIRFEGDLAQLGRVLRPVVEREKRRVGGSLAKGAY